MATRSVGPAWLCGALVFLCCEAAQAHLAHPGYTGFISTPTPEVLAQGSLSFGFSWIDGRNTYLFSPKTNRIYAVTAGVLPGLEGTLRQTQAIGWYPGDAPGVAYGFDRMFSAKYAVPAPRGIPKVAVGIQDLASANFLAGVAGLKPGVTQYGQTTAYGVIGEKHKTWTWHGGIGISQAFINGFFGGISYQPLDHLNFLVEWDSKRLNWGLRVIPTGDWWLQISQLGLDTWGISSGVAVLL